MKIVIITGTFYPALSPRSHRATELAKELARLGHEVIVYVPYKTFDYSEFSEKTGVKVNNIKMTFQTLYADGNVKACLLQRIFTHGLQLHKLIDFPNVEFVWKVPGILEKEKNVDLLITIAMPHPIHWGTAVAKRRLKEKFPPKWIADCGDPFVGNITAPAFSYFKYVEKFWGKYVDYITVPIADAAPCYHPTVQEKIRVIPQGFDFSNVKINEGQLSHKCPHFAFSGTVFIGQRDPRQFLEYLETLSTDFVFTVYTKIPKYYEKYKASLGEKLILKQYVPHNQLIYELSEQDFLININNSTNTQAPSKLIDYNLVKRPYMNISTVFTEKDIFEEFLAGDYSHAQKPIDLTQYDIRNIAQKFLSL